MISSAVFGRYARSLADVVLEKREDSAVARDLSLYREIFLAVPDLLETFHNPAIPREIKQKILSELLARYPAAQTTANFLRVLLDHNRMRYFHEIFDLFTRTVNERNGIITAQVASASPLSESNQSQLRESLSRTTGKNVLLDMRTDKDLLGGVVVRVGSTVYDGSVRRQLAEVRQRLME
jgi:F-type H+-transporting ATPase subunit delta